MQQYEIEIKCLLGEATEADRLREAMKDVDPNARCTSTNKQLNHYFVGGDIQELYSAVKKLFSKQKQEDLLKIVEDGETFSIRTRERDGTVLFIVKASLDSSTSDNGVSRIEFEEQVDMSLSELDELVLGAGFEYQAKWSRDREEYACGGTTICLDKNAGYGYLAELEKIVEDTEEIESVKKELYELMDKLGVTELPQDRLERMFAHYNTHWPEYYGTDKVFHID